MRQTWVRNDDSKSVNTRSKAWWWMSNEENRRLEIEKSQFERWEVTYTWVMEKLGLVLLFICMNYNQTYYIYDIYKFTLI